MMQLSTNKGFPALNNTQIKYIACFFMLLDHFALILLPGDTFPYLLLRGLGRLAAPLFFWTISEGAHYSKHKGKYLGILLGFGVLFQLFFMGFSGEELSILGFLSSYKNIFITLSIGLMGLFTLEKAGGKLFPAMLIAGVFSIAGSLLNVDYGWYGILMIFIFYYFREKKSSLFLGIVLLNLSYFVVASSSGNFLWPLLQMASIISLGIVFLHNGERGQGNKYFFYLFYPLHLGFLELIKYLIQ